MSDMQNLKEAAAFVQKQISIKPKVGIILGSGLASFVDQVSDQVKVAYENVPNMVRSTVEGHPGQFVFGKIHGTPVAVMQGRLHAYEGYEFSKVVFPVRLMKLLGVETLIITNASGGLLDGMKPGDFMVLRDQINLTGNNPLVGPNLSELGPRFPDMTEPFDKTLSDRLVEITKRVHSRVFEGVYMGVLGPSYETAAEIRYMKQIGGGAVGMSTVAEVFAGRHMGMKICGLSCITNLGTGLSKEKLSHDDVKHVAALVEKSFAKIISDLIKESF